MVEMDFPTYIVLNRAFSPQECEEILRIGHALPESGSAIFGDKKDTKLRSSQVAWMPRGFDAELEGKIMYYASHVNQSKYGFHLSQQLEPLQFTKYTHLDDHYDWHKDLGPGKHSIRKLSFSIQLTHPKDYEGANLEFFLHQGHHYRNQGSMILFPSFELHRVTSLIRGERFALVGWASGKPFA